MPLMRCLELQIPPGELLDLPKGWEYGQHLGAHERLLLHESGNGVIVTEIHTDETIDAVFLREVLQSALSSES